jgi:hypothetical protein
MVNRNSQELAMSNEPPRRIGRKFAANKESAQICGKQGKRAKFAAGY